ncbi:7-carboxy-7-deazaguanine synthase QueE [Archaeoglobus sp.]
MFVGVKQLFVRFSKCNLNCIYCDTQKNSKICKDFVNNRTLRNPVSLGYIIDVMRSVKVHSVSWTGGEPLLYADFIRNVEKVHPFYLESNMTLPEKAKILRDVVDYVAGDFKVREAIPNENYEEVFENTVRCFRILKNTKRRFTFCKVVLPSSFDFEGVVECVEAVERYISSVVLQPVFGVENVKILMKLQDKLLDVCDVRIIPQVHKYLGLR